MSSTGTVFELLVLGVLSHYTYLPELGTAMSIMAAIFGLMSALIMKTKHKPGQLPAPTRVIFVMAAAGFNVVTMALLIRHVSKCTDHGPDPNDADDGCRREIARAIAACAATAGTLDEIAVLIYKVQGLKKSAIELGNTVLDARLLFSRSD